MKRNQLYQLAIVVTLPVILVSFQNCGSGQMSFEGTPTPTAAKNEVQAFTCSGHALGSTWIQDTGTTVSVPQACQFGGNLSYNYQVQVSMSCAANGAAAGATSNGDLVGSRGACNPPVCGSHADASTWLVNVGVVQKPYACPDSGSTIVQDYAKIAHYKCNGGTADITEYTTGDFIGNESKCPEPMLTASFSAPKANVDSSVQLVVKSSTVAVLSYSCSNGQSGNLAVGTANVDVKVSADVKCDVRALTSRNATLTASATVMVTCDADQNYVNGKCEDKNACASFVELTGANLQVPARSTAGVCYYKKLYSAVANSRSTGTRDTNVISRDHDDNQGTSNPYIMGTGPLTFTMAGARDLKLSGKGTSLSPILVDNYVLVGSRLASSTSSARDNVWQAYGTSDATIPGTNYVQAYGGNVVVTPFASGGTATVRPILFDSIFAPSKSYVLDVRALDCGGAREMSDVYLIFQ